MMMHRVPRRCHARKVVRALPGIFMLPLLLLASAGHAADKKITYFKEMPPKPMHLGVEDKRYLAFGQAMYDYYDNRKFAAMNRLLVNEKEGLFGKDTDYAELLLGDLYVTFGLPEKAEEIFNKLLKRDLLQQTRAETWFHKGQLNYKQGNYNEAIKVLDSDKVKGLPKNLQSEKDLMLANSYMYKGDFGGAMQFLYNIPSNTKEGAYANYNMGVAMIRSDHKEDGEKLLTAVMNMPAGDAETNALKDRSALAIGTTELQQKHYDKARDALSRVRADGPFSNQALLALGMANYKLGAPKKALPLWLELVRRDPGHRSVQEALMMAPLAYEDLGAMPQALAGYQYAATTYRQELKKVELGIRRINKGTWLDKLKPQTPSEQAVPDPMAPIQDYTAAHVPEMAYLYKLFASHDFSQLFHQYMVVDRLHKLLQTWGRDLPALGQTLAAQKSRFSGVLQSVRGNLVQVRKQQQQLSDKAQALSADIPQNLDIDHPEQLANLKQLVMWNRIQSLQSELEKRPDSAQTREYRKRLKRVRGLLLWDIAHDAPKERDQQETEANNLVEETDTAGIRVKAVEQLVRDASLRLHGDLDNKFAAQYQRINKLTADSEGILKDIRQVLKNDALQVLAENRQRLANKLGDAHLAIARVQDESVTKKITGGEDK